MILRRLELQAFGRFEDEVIEFAPGMNLVSGPNESGKTTLLLAVVAVLFGDDDFARFVPWDSSGICRAALLVEIQGRQVRIERDFFTGCVGWFEMGADGTFVPVFCGCLESGGGDVDRAAYLSRLQGLLGVCHRDLFQTLLYGDPSMGGGGFTPERLKACFSDVETVAFGDTLKSLQSEYLAISNDNPWGLQANSEGELQVISRRLAALEKEWFALQEMIRHRPPSEARELSVGSIEDTSVDAETFLPQEPELSEPMPDDLAGTATPIDLKAGASADDASRHAQLEAELAKTGLPRNIPAQLPELLSSCASLRQSMAEQKRGLSLRQEERRRCRPPGWQAPAWGLAATWAAILSWSWAQSTTLPIWGGVLASAAIGAWHARRSLQARSAGQQLDSQVAVVEARVDELQQQLSAMNDRFEALGLSPSPVETVRMQKNLPRHQQLFEQLRQLDNVRDGVDADTTVTEPTLPAMVSVPVGEARFDTISAHSPAEPAPAGTCCMQDAGGSLSTASLALGEFASLESLLEARTRIEAEGEVLRARESRLKQRRKTLVVECDLLGETLAEYPGADLEIFCEILGKVMNSLTGGAIDRVHVTEDFVVQLPGADGIWLPVERFSSATRTLLQVALCLSLNQLRCESLRLPLLLDDPLGALDKKRRGQALKVLEQCAAGQQVILFSHEDALHRRAMRDSWHLVSLRTMGPSVAAGKEEKNNDDGQLSFL